MPSSSMEETGSAIDHLYRKDKNCLVCGDKALGYNFNAVTCESCKAFFRRNAHKTIKGRCHGRCDVTVESRSFCKRCRLAKCFTVGMRKDMILNKEQREQRRQKIIINKLRKNGQMDAEDIYSVSGRDLLYQIDTSDLGIDPAPTTGSRNKRSQKNASSTILVSPPSSYSQINPNQPPIKKEKFSYGGSPGSGQQLPLASPVIVSNDVNIPSSCLPLSQAPWHDRDADKIEAAIVSLETDDRKVIREIMDAMHSTSFLTTTSSSLASIPASPEEFVNMAENFVRKMIRLGKMISAFKMLQRQDQVGLLKSSVVDVMMLRSAVNYDPFTETWSLNTKDCLNKGSGKADGARLRADMLMNASVETRRLFMNYSKFIKGLMSTIHGDLVVLKILIVMSMFSADRLPMAHHNQVQAIQERFGLVLQSYVNARFDNEATLFARIIMKLTDLRNINEFHSNMLMAMKMDELEPLLLEIFDLPRVPSDDEDACQSGSGSGSSICGSSSSSARAGGGGGWTQPSPDSST